MTSLKDLLIIDLTRALAGPYCTMLLGDLGAEVIKIEKPKEGDETRSWGPPFINGESSYFLSVNRNKKSLTLDFKKSEGQEILKKLIKIGDILVENFRPGTLKKIGLDYDSVRELNPRLIYCSISGFGQNGPYAKKPGYDLIAQGMGGIMGITGEEGGIPIKVGVAISDIGGGMFAAVGILAALLHREKTGMGQYIDTSLFDSQISWLTFQAGYYFATKENPKKLGNAHPNIAPYQSFKTKDKYINISVGNDKLWENFCKALQREDLIRDSRFEKNAKRVENRKKLVEIIEEELSKREAEYWLKIFEENGIPVGPVLSIEEIFSNPHTLAREMLVEIKHPKVGNLKMTGIPLKFSQTKGEIRLPPPLLGEHTEEILKRLNFSADEIEELRRKEVI